jgi:hypothetical protein
MKTLHHCDICLILDGDKTIQLCTYCKVCRAYICDDDLNNWTRRGKALALRVQKFLTV